MLVCKRQFSALPVLTYLKRTFRSGSRKQPFSSQPKLQFGPPSSHN